MLNKRLENISSVLKSFTGKNGEPKNDKEKYILNSMWVMLCSEFEGSIKDLVESYIDSVKQKINIKDMHICFLMQNFYGNKMDDKFTVGQIMGLFNKKKDQITYSNFTRDKKIKNKSFSVENLFNSLGIFFEDDEKTKLKLLDGIASTRDSIVHGDHGISITRKQLEDSIKTINDIYQMLKSKSR